LVINWRGVEIDSLEFFSPLRIGQHNETLRGDITIAIQNQLLKIRHHTGGCQFTDPLISDAVICQIQRNQFVQVDALAQVTDGAVGDETEVLWQVDGGEGELLGGCP